MSLMKSVIFYMIIAESFISIHSKNKILTNNKVIDIPVTNNSSFYPDYRILFSIDIIKNNSVFNPTYNNSDFFIIDDSGSSHAGKINVNVAETKERKKTSGS